MREVLFVCGDGGKNSLLSLYMVNVLMASITFYKLKSVHMFCLYFTSLIATDYHDSFLNNLVCQ